MEWVPTLKDVFFFIGASLGIISFFQNVITSLQDSNKQKWQLMKDRVTEEDFKSLEYEIWHQHLISNVAGSDHPYNKIQAFIYDIRDDAEYLRFGPLYRKRFAEHLGKIESLFEKLSTQLKSNYWERKFHRDKENGEIENLGIGLNKDLFYTQGNNGLELGDYLYETTQIVEDMRIEYRSLYFLCNLHAFELPFAPRITTQRAKLPESAKT